MSGGPLERFKFRNNCCACYTVNGNTLSVRNKLYGWNSKPASYLAGMRKFGLTAHHIKKRSSTPTKSMFGPPPGPLTSRQRRHTSDNVATPLSHVSACSSQYESHEVQQACAVRALEEANMARAEQLKLLTETLSIMVRDDPLRLQVEAQRSRTLQEMGIYSSFSVIGPEAVTCTATTMAAAC